MQRGEGRRRIYTGEKRQNNWNSGSTGEKPQKTRIRPVVGKNEEVKYCDAEGAS